MTGSVLPRPAANSHRSKADERLAAKNKAPDRMRILWAGSQVKRRATVARPGLGLTVNPTKAPWPARGCWVTSERQQSCRFRCFLAAPGGVGMQSCSQSASRQGDDGLAQLGKPVVGGVPSMVILWLEGPTCVWERGGS